MERRLLPWVFRLLQRVPVLEPQCPLHALSLLLWVVDDRREPEPGRFVSRVRPQELGQQLSSRLPVTLPDGFLGGLENLCFLH